MRFFSALYFFNSLGIFSFFDWFCLLTYTLQTITVCHIPIRRRGGRIGSCACTWFFLPLCSVPLIYMSLSDQCYRFPFLFFLLLNNLKKYLCNGNKFNVFHIYSFKYIMILPTLFLSHTLLPP